MSDRVTLAVWAGTPWLWLAVELLILWKRGKWKPGDGTLLHTISMIARDRGWQVPCYAYFWSAMPIHWWVPLGWGSTAGGVAFWSILVVLAGWNAYRLIARRTTRLLSEWPTWERWLNFPAWYVAGGAVAAALLFPQSGPVPWRP